MVLNMQYIPWLIIEPYVHLESECQREDDERTNANVLVDVLQIVEESGQLRCYSWIR